MHYELKKIYYVKKEKQKQSQYFRKYNTYNIRRASVQADEL